MGANSQNMLPPGWLVRPGQRSPVLSRAMCSAASSTRRNLRSRIYVPTLKQAPKDATTPGHQLMYRAGMIRKSSAGHFSLLPLGIRVLNKLERLIDQHMDSIGGQKTQLPSLLPRELWERSGRWDSTGDELMKMHDRHGNEHCLAPTHEEAICAMVAQDLVSYKQLPLMLYQVGPKFRDEVRPRFGLLRAREFVMKDMYSFHATAECATECYQTVLAAYQRLFETIGVPWRRVEADTGMIGGSASHEFHVLSESTGEDELLLCDSCGYSANSELAVSNTQQPVEPCSELQRQVQQAVTDPVQATQSEMLKIEFFRTADVDQVAVVLPAAERANDVKVERLLSTPVWRTAAPATVASDVRILLDSSLGSAAPDASDVRLAQGGDSCAQCSDGNLSLVKGIEVGHCFVLGDKYSASAGATFVNAGGKDRIAAQMGCYGLGVTRIMAAVAEAQHDKDGLMWPWALAPYRVLVLPTSDDPELMAQAEALYDQLQATHSLRGEVLIDDRKERPGIKLKEAALAGFPFTVVVGKAWTTRGELELQVRGTKLPIVQQPDAIVEHLVSAALAFEDPL